MGGDRISLKNADGYKDPTAFTALNNTLRDEQHYYLIRTLLSMIRLAGFECACRIELRDTVTGRLYK